MREHILARRGRLVTSGLVLAGIVAAAAVGLTFLRGTPAHASGSGGGGCTTLQTSSCSFSGATANAMFESYANGVYTGANVWVGENVTQAPPASPTTQSQVIVEIDTCDSIGNCDGAFGYATDVAFTASKLDSASLSATVPVTDWNSGNTYDVTINLTWQGYGSTVSWDDNTHFRGNGFIFSEHDQGTSRSTTATGTISDGTTNYAQSPSLYNLLEDSSGGMVQITR